LSIFAPSPKIEEKPVREARIRKLLQLFPMISVALLGLAAIGCSGMAGLGGVPSGGGFADSNTSPRDSDHSKINSGNSLDAREESNNDPGVASAVDPAITGANAGGAPAPIAGKNSPNQLAAAGDPFAGYRPGQEGQVQKGANVRVSVSDLRGRVNCKRPDGEAYDTLFTETDFPMVYLWMAEGPQGPYAPTARLKPANEYGIAMFTCRDDSDPARPVEYPYALLMATFLDSKGVQHQSEKLSVPCPSVSKSEFAEFCLNFPGPSMKALPLEGGVNGASLRKPLPLLQDTDPN